ncbi:putative reverse transcriptase domain-containing protein [Tanacetum coccineum]
MEEIVFLAIPRGNLTDTPIILEATTRGFKVQRIYIDEGSSSEIMYEHCFKSFGAHTKVEGVECSTCWIFRGNLPPSRVGGPLGGHGGTRKKQNTHVGICYSKMPLPLQRHPRKDGDEKILGGGYEAGGSSPKECRRVRLDAGSRVGDQCYTDQTKGWYLASAYKLHKPQQGLSEGHVSLPRSKRNLGSLIGHQYKYFLRSPKEGTHVWMSEDDEEKTAFHTEEGVAKGKKRGSILRGNGHKEQLRTVYLKEQDANPSSLCESSAARNGDLLHSDRESSIDIDPHNKMPQKDLKNLQDQCGNEQPHGKNVKEPGDLRTIGPVGSRVEEIPNFIYSKRRSRWSSSGIAFQERRTSITNDMDYEALLVGLAAAAGRQMKHLHVFVNSKLLVDQLEGNSEPKKEGAMIYKEEVMDATTPFHRFRITHLPKALILKTEALTRLATIQLGFLNQEVSVGVKTRPSIEAPDKPFDETKNLLNLYSLWREKLSYIICMVSI